MILELHSTYKFKNSEEWVTLLVLDVGMTSYEVEVVNAMNGSGWDLGHRFRLPKETGLFRNYQVMQINSMETSDIEYTPALINLYIEIALINGDKQWFMELTNMKKELLVNG